MTAVNILFSFPVFALRMHASLACTYFAAFVYGSFDSMSESESSPPAKVPRRAHVTLTQGPDVAQDSTNFVVVGHRVREDVAERSGLLSGLAHVDGLASLPDDISPEDVQLWQASRLRGLDPSTDELVTIVKVSRCTSVQTGVHLHLCSPCDHDDI